MPYYCFIECGEDKVPELEALANEFGMKSVRTHSGNVWERNYEDGGASYCLLNHTPNRPKGLRPTNIHTQLLLQTSSLEPNPTSETLDLIRRLISITGTEEIFQHDLETPFDMTEFE